MANPELVKAMDYILNRCDEKAIDAVAAAVVRRRRDLAMFGSNVPDVKKMAKEATGQINMGASIEGLRETVRNMAVRLIRKEAPELNEEQIAQLTAAWIPNRASAPTGSIPPDMLIEMIDNFVSFSSGTMSRAEDSKLRKELGVWPERYWNAFPEVIKIIIKDYLNGDIDKKTYRKKIVTALSLDNP